MKKVVVTLLLFLVFLCGEYDYGYSTDTFTLKELTVTESKIEQMPHEITHKIDVVDSEEIKNLNLPNRNLSELLRYQPGSFANPLSRNDANWGSYSGLGPKYNVWLLDGLPIDSFVDPMSLSSLYLKRIEVHRGPASVLYPNYMTMDFAGNETPLAGITNLITKDKILSPYTNISLGYGSWKTFNARAYNEGSKDDFHYLLGADYEQSDYINYGTKPSWLNMIDDPEYKKFKGFFKTTYYFNPESKISLFFHHTQHTGDAGRPHRGYDHIYDIVNVSFENALSKDLFFSMKAGYRYYHRSWEEDNYPNLSLKSEDGVKQNIYPVDASINYKHFNKSIFTAGIDYQGVTYDTYSITNGIKALGNDVKANNFGFYAQEKLIIDKWVLRGGIRYNYTKHNYALLSGVAPEVSSKKWTNAIWSLGVRYNITEQAGIFTNVGTSYLVPSAKSVGGTLKSADKGVPGKNGQLPNPGLSPEKGISYDIGADIWLTNNFYANLRGFYHKTDDTIVENVVSQNPSQTQSVNAGEANTKGLEVDLQYVFTNKFKAFSNMTFAKSEIKNPIDKKQDSADISFVPNFIFNAGFSAKLPYEFSVSPYFQYIGKYYDSTDKTTRKEFGKYATLNVNLQKQLFKKNEHSSNLILELNNIFDKKFEMPWQFQDPGFNAMIRWELVF